MDLHRKTIKLTTANEKKNMSETEMKICSILGGGRQSIYIMSISFNLIARENFNHQNNSKKLPQSSFSINVIKDIN